LYLHTELAVTETTEQSQIRWRWRWGVFGTDRREEKRRVERGMWERGRRVERVGETEKSRKRKVGSRGREREGRTHREREREREDVHIGDMTWYVRERERYNAIQCERGETKTKLK
jgi:hypothetical protein